MKWNHSFDEKFSTKREIEGLLFSRFYQSYRNITVPFASAHLYQCNLDEIRGCFLKLHVEFPFDFPSEQQFFFYTNGKHSRIALFHLKDNAYQVFRTDGKHSIAF